MSARTAGPLRARSTFTIPMRGNEELNHHELNECSRFTIPMRGNEQADPLAAGWSSTGLRSP